MPPQQDTILETVASRDTNNQPLNSDSLRIVTLNCKNIQTCGPFFNDMINDMDIHCMYDSGTLAFQLSDSIIK